MIKIKAAILLLCIAPALYGAGISVDSGLTPALGRWILRSQVRLMGREAAGPGMNEMNTTMVPVVLAYGLRPELTLMLRQSVLNREMGQRGNSGLGDTFIMAKYKALRINTRAYTFGLAPTLGIELPSGSAEYSSDTWDLRPGLIFTFRHGMLSADLSLAYQWNGMAQESSAGVVPGHELAMDFAVARQFGLNEDYSRTLAPVLEISWHRTLAAKIDGSRMSDSGESVLLVSPGIKLSASSVILEALVQSPVWQSQKGNLAGLESTFLLGIRYLF